jgi:short subunit dehydrogenase-like uncharacterized protein
MAKLMIYGANGYTGKLVSEQAKTLGLDLVLAGRSKTSLQPHAMALDAPYRIFDLTDPELVHSSFTGIKVLLNCASPFARTAKPLIDACLRNGVHYLDTSAELISYEIAERMDRQAKNGNVILLPGSGGSVAMLGCLARRALEVVGDPQLVECMDLALHVSGPMSHGSAIVVKESLAAEILQRRGGCLVSQGVMCTAQFDFEDGRGSVDCVPVTLPELITVHRFLGVQTLRTFLHASEGTFSSGDHYALSNGPTTEERHANPYDAAVTITAKDGSVKRAVLHSINGYSFTSIASVEAARRLLRGQYLPGFQTSAILFGVDFAESILDTKASAPIEFKQS